MISSERDVAAFVRGTTEDPASLREAFAQFLWTGEGVGLPASALGDPHALGWLHQYLAEEERKRAFRRHTADEAKHSSQTSTTQLYTPRWLADWLVARCIEASGMPDRVLDPACGGGQMLLAAAAALIERGRDPRDAFSSVRGRDLDPHAVWACRESLKLAAWRAMGLRDDAVERAIDANVQVSDGLANDLEPADIVLTNPPYMGSRSMSVELRGSLAAFAPFHHDLYLAFVRRCTELSTGSVGILAQQTLWYLKRFEAARRALLEAGDLTDFAHLGAGVFDALSGEKATVVAFVWRGGPSSGQPTRFRDLRAATDKRNSIADPPILVDASRFEVIPAAPLAFWLPEPLLDVFGGATVGDVAEIPGSQNKTGNNGLYVRPIEDAPADWVPYSKGGKFAPWWGNMDWAVDWSPDARRFYASNPTSNLLDEKYWFREGLCYSDFGGSHFNARWMPPGCLFDMAGPAIFVDDDDRDLLAALLVVLNSTVAREILNALNPTLHFQVRDVRNLPLPRWDDASIARLAALGHQLVAEARSALEGARPFPLALELEADLLVAASYGAAGHAVPLQKRRRHHRLPAHSR